MAGITGRALHYVFKIGDRKATVAFYRNVLGMKVLRHEEFADGCDAACNGPYANRWSKTMVGYGPEDTHFVVELTYNYPIKSYDLGNDFLGITIKGSEILERAKKQNYPIQDNNILVAPGGYKFFIVDEPQPVDTGKATVRVIILADPDGHEICFVDDEAFKELSKMEPEDEKILDRFMLKDQP